LYRWPANKSFVHYAAVFTIVDKPTLFSFILVHYYVVFFSNYILKSSFDFHVNNWKTEANTFTPETEGHAMHSILNFKELQL